MKDNFPLLAFNKSVPAGDTSFLAESVSKSAPMLYKAPTPTISTSVSFYYLLYLLKYLS